MDNCLICSNNQYTIKKCKICKNNICMKCIYKWHNQNKKYTCPFCRTNTYSSYNLFCCFCLIVD